MVSWSAPGRSMCSSCLFSVTRRGCVLTCAASCGFVLSVWSLVPVWPRSLHYQQVHVCALLGLISTVVRAGVGSPLVCRAGAGLPGILPLVVLHSSLSIGQRPLLVACVIPSSGKRLRSSAPPPPPPPHFFYPACTIGPCSLSPSHTHTHTHNSNNRSDLTAEGAVEPLP